MNKRGVRILIATLLSLGGQGALTTQSVIADNAIIDSMDAMSFQSPAEKGKVELVEGKTGQALKFSFDNDNKGVFARGRARGNPEWDKAAGFSFWVKGDGSPHLGGIEVIWNEDYSARYGYAFPIDSTEWKKIVVPWRDLIPELSKVEKPISAQGGNAPSKLGPISFGKWWYWQDYAAHSYIIDDIRLEPVIEPDTTDYRPKGAPLARTLAKLKAGRPITMVTMGDSLTDFAHWANRETNWPTLLQTKLKEKYGSEVKLINPAIGGTELRQNMILMPRWTSTTPAPDLVTIFFGFNDWSSGMTAERFRETMKDAVDRIRRATKGHADVLILTSCPTLTNGEEFSGLADAGRKAATEQNAGLADIYHAFQATGQVDKDQLFAHDKVHLGPAGHGLVAQTMMETMEKGGR